MSGTASQRPALVLIGWPELSRWALADSMQCSALARHWELRIEGQGAATRPVAVVPALPWLEHAYQRLDRLLFGRKLLGIETPPIKAWAPEPGRSDVVALAWSAADAQQFGHRGDMPCLWVEFESRPMGELASAVRQRIGVPGGTVAASVWLQRADGSRTALLQGQLEMDHRSLCQSIGMCAAKLPALLRGAIARLNGELAGAAIPPVLPQSPSGSLRQLFRLAKSIGKRLLWREQWRMVVHSPAQAPPRLVTPPAAVFWADPFLVEHSQGLWLIFEELPFRSNKGHISAMELDAQGCIISGPHLMLSEPWHLAYPFPIQHEGRWLMLPDASKSRQLNLYECQEWPQRWTLRKTLIANERLADATVIHFGDRLWMFATHGDEDASVCDTLHLYWADHIDGPWKPHPLNPVKIDARTARPAGAMWVEDGVLHRVVQDCSSVYGGAIHCMRIRRLDEQGFDEEIVPGWRHARADYSEPRHTFNVAAGIAVSDRLMRVPRWMAK